MANLRMNVVALLVLMAAIGISIGCKEGCTATKKYENQYFRLIPELSQSSVAPWTLKRTNHKNGRMLKNFQYAECTSCRVQGLVAKEIFLEVSLFERVRNGTEFYYCRCPYKLAVGCTCV
ncbi:uncharacterized protein ACNS7B_008086 [Menidia menidia]